MPLDTLLGSSKSTYMPIQVSDSVRVRSLNIEEAVTTREE